MDTANFLQHGLEICFGISCVSAAQDGGIEISYVVGKCQFYIPPPSVENRVSSVAMQVKKCSLFEATYRGIRDLR
jgi:hypothetical protein